MSCVHVYSLCWNEMEMLPFYLRHYRDVASRFFIFDDSSNDGSVQYLSGQPDVEVSRFHKDKDSFVLAAQRFYNECWKRSRGEADWVIICNIDEHLHHPDLPGYLDAQRDAGVTVIPSRGFQMISDRFPEPHETLARALRSGMPWPFLDKVSIFNPNAVDDINYCVGRHTTEPAGQVRMPATREVKLLHYKYLGLPYLIRRTAELRTGLRAIDIENRWGHHYLWSNEEIQRDFALIKSRAVVAVLPEITR
jgi:hypothetical protein